MANLRPNRFEGALRGLSQSPFGHEAALGFTNRILQVLDLPRVLKGLELIEDVDGHS
jgi:hypothetical protein